jgi:hypothetical protein
MYYNILILHKWPQITIMTFTTEPKIFAALRPMARFESADGLHHGLLTRSNWTGWGPRWLLRSVALEK